jgi:hypothetical protein
VCTRTLCQVGLPFRATASNSCRENIGLSNLFPDSTLYRKIAERPGILSYRWILVKGKNDYNLIIMTSPSRVEMCGTSPGPGSGGRDQKKNFTGTDKKLPGPGPNKKSYRDLDRDRDQKKLVPHISSPEFLRNM